MTRLTFFFLLGLTATSSLHAQIFCGDCDLDGMADTVLDALAASRISTGVAAPMGDQPCACDVNNSGMIDVIDVLLLAQRAAGLPVTLTCPAPLCGGPPTNEPPGVTINLPGSGATVTGDVPVNFDTVDPNTDPLVSTFEFSLNGGATWNPCTMGAGGTVGANPTAPSMPAAGQVFSWASAADGVGLAGPQLAVIRVLTDDGTLSAQAIVLVIVDNSIACFGVTCGNGSAIRGAGAGPGMPFAAFNFGVDAFAFAVDTSGRTPGDAVDIFIQNMTSDFDLYIADRGIGCGNPDPTNYTFANIGGGQVGLGAELHVFGDAELVARGEVVNVVVHNFDATAMADVDLGTTCRPIDTCQATIVCGAPPTAGATGTLGSPMLPAMFTTGGAGDSFHFELDASTAPAGTGIQVNIANQVGSQIAGLLLAPGVPCGYQESYTWTGIQTFANGADDVFLLTPDLIALFPDGLIPMVVYNLDPGMPATFDIEAICPMVGPCEGTVTCGSMVSNSVDMGTGGMITEFTFGAGGDADAWTLDTSMRNPGEAVRVRLTNLTSNVSLILQTPGMPCGWPLTWNVDFSDNPGTADEEIILTDAQIAGFGTEEFTIVVYHIDPNPTANYDLIVDCFPLGGCTGTVEGVLDEAALGLPMPGMPLIQLGDTTGADDTTMFLCGAGGDVGGPDHIYEWIPATAGPYNLSTCNSALDTQLAVRELDCLFGADVGCNDDACGAMGFQSTIAGLMVTPGASYYILIDSWGGAPDAYELQIEVTAAMACSSVEGVLDEAALGGVPLQQMGDTTGADDSETITCGVAGSIGGADHVYEFIPAATQTYTFSLCTSAYDTSFTIVEGGCGGTVVACDDDTCAPTTTFESIVTGVPLTAGTSYFLVVDGWNGSEGAYILDITSP